MPRAKTGCNYVLYTLVTKESLEKLNEMAERARDKDGKKLGRPLLMDAIIRRAYRLPLPQIKAPEYSPHKRIPRKILKTSPARA